MTSLFFGNIFLERRYISRENYQCSCYWQSIWYHKIDKTHL